MKYISVLLVIVSVALVGSYSFKIYDAKGGDVIQGKSQYMAHCLSCHGEKGYGDGVLAQSLPSKPSHLPSELNSFFNYDSILISRIVMKGKIEEGMPAFEGILNQQDVKDIFAYIRSVN